MLTDRVCGYAHTSPLQLIKRQLFGTAGQPEFFSLLSAGSDAALCRARGSNYLLTVPGQSPAPRLGRTTGW